LTTSLSFATVLSFSNRPFLTTTLSFVIPSEAEGSAVPRTFPGYVFSAEWSASLLTFLYWVLKGFPFVPRHSCESLCSTSVGGGPS
jgi:hypothetical protein